MCELETTVALKGLSQKESACPLRNMTSIGARIHALAGAILRTTEEALLEGEAILKHLSLSPSVMHTSASKGSVSQERNSPNVSYVSQSCSISKFRCARDASSSAIGSPLPKGNSSNSRRSVGSITWTELKHTRHRQSTGTVVSVATSTPFATPRLDNATVTSASRNTKLSTLRKNGITKAKQIKSVPALKEDPVCSAGPTKFIACEDDLSSYLRGKPTAGTFQELLRIRQEQEQQQQEQQAQGPPLCLVPSEEYLLFPAEGMARRTGSGIRIDCDAARCACYRPAPLYDKSYEAYLCSATPLSVTTYAHPRPSATGDVAGVFVSSAAQRPSLLEKAAQGSNTSSDTFTALHTALSGLHSSLQRLSGAFLLPRRMPAERELSESEALAVLARRVDDVDDGGDAVTVLACDGLTPSFSPNTSVMSCWNFNARYFEVVYIHRFSMAPGAQEAAFKPMLSEELNYFMSDDSLRRTPSPRAAPGTLVAYSSQTNTDVLGLPIVVGDQATHATTPYVRAFYFCRPFIERKATFAFSSCVSSPVSSLWNDVHTGCDTSTSVTMANGSPLISSRSSTIPSVMSGIIAGQWIVHGMPVALESGRDTENEGDDTSRLLMRVHRLQLNQQSTAAVACEGAAVGGPSEPGGKEEKGEASVGDGMGASSASESFDRLLLYTAGCSSQHAMEKSGSDSCAIQKEGEEIMMSRHEGSDIEDTNDEAAQEAVLKVPELAPICTRQVLGLIANTNNATQHSGCASSRVFIEVAVAGHYDLQEWRTSGALRRREQYGVLPQWHF